MRSDDDVLPGVPLGISTDAVGDVVVHTWAPLAERVELVVLRDGDEHGVHALEDHPRGHVAGRLGLAELGVERLVDLRYRFRLHRADGTSVDRADPASRHQPDGVHGPSAPDDPSAFPWQHDHWRVPRRHQQVVYELHVGTVTPAGTFDGAIERLDHLARLGVTVVEVMPVAPFAGARNWGYDGVFFHAVHHAYGGPDGMRRFVDACHARGIAVWLDVVFNHVGPEGNVLGEFGPFFGRGQNTWGAGLNTDGPGSDAVRRFVVQAARQWVRDLRVDGFRLDAVHAIADSSPVHVLAAFTAAAREEAARQGREVHVVAESDLADASLVDAVEDGGWGVDGVWDDDVHHVWHTELTGERDGYYVDFQGIAGDEVPGRDGADLERLLRDRYVYSGTWSPFRRRTVGAPARGYAHDRFVACLQNHDQVGNRPAGDRLVHLVDHERLRAATLFLLCGPFTPMLFQGEEWGETRPFPFFCSHTDDDLVEAVRKGRREEFRDFASWGGVVPDPQDPATFASAVLADPPRDNGWLRLYRDALAARRDLPPVADPAAGEPTVVADGRVARYRREGPPGTGAVELVVNLSDASVAHRVRHGSWAVVVDTGWERYGNGYDPSPTPVRGRRLGVGAWALSVPARTAVLLHDDAGPLDRARGEAGRAAAGPRIDNRAPGTDGSPATGGATIGEPDDDERDAHRRLAARRIDEGADA